MSQELPFYLRAYEFKSYELPYLGANELSYCFLAFLRQHFPKAENAQCYYKAPRRY
jgi:hypothetical protein